MGSIPTNLHFPEKQCDAERDLFGKIGWVFRYIGVLLSCDLAGATLPP